MEVILCTRRLQTWGWVGVRDLPLGVEVETESSYLDLVCSRKLYSFYWTP